MQNKAQFETTSAVEILLNRCKPDVYPTVISKNKPAKTQMAIRTNRYHPSVNMLVDKRRIARTTNPARYVTILQTSAVQ
jgi:hypothetical protein